MCRFRGTEQTIRRSPSNVTKGGTTMKRKTIALVLASLLVLSAFAALPAMAASISTTVTTTNKSDTLRVRKGPHKGDTPTVDFVVNKQAITLIDWNDEDDPEDWAKIKVKRTGAVGYLKNKYIKYFGLSNHDGELDPHEDDDVDWRDAGDNDGHGGSGGTTSASGFGRVQTNGGSVNVRSKASSSSSKVGTAYNGQRLTLSGKSGSWFRVKTSSGLSGYIYSTYVREGAFAYTTASKGVNMRKGAGTSYSIIRSLPYGTEITVFSETNGWGRVKVGSTYGYVYNSYYKFS